MKSLKESSYGPQLATRHVEPKPVVIKRKQSNHASVACVISYRQHASKDGRFTRIAENTIKKKRSRKSTHKKSLTINNFMCSSSAILNFMNSCPLTHNHCAPFLRRWTHTWLIRRSSRATKFGLPTPCLHS